MNKRLRLAVRNADCTLCKMHNQAEGDDVCVTGQGPSKARVMVVTKFPLGETGRTKKELEGYLREVGINPASVMWCSAVKCRVWDLDPSKGDLKKCSPYLRAELAQQNPDFVLALGAEAWFAVSGWADITKHRGKLFDVAEGDGIIFPTISPSAVGRNPGLRDGFLADLRYFARIIAGEADNVAPDHTPGDRVTRVDTKDALRTMLKAWKRVGVGSYDIETTMSEWTDPEARVVSLCVTTATKGMEDAHVWQIPLCHPESPFRRVWERILQIVTRALGKIPKLIAHNAKFDTKWLRHFGDESITPTFDTIIAAALLNENRPKGLKPLAQQLLGADPWGIDTKNLMDDPLDDVLEYNGLDTWHTLRLYYRLKADLLKQPRLARLFRHLMMPAIQELVDVERRGVYVDQDRMHNNWATVKGTLDAIHEQLMEFIPPREVWPDGIKEVNFNASNFARWWLFDHLELPILARGKAKDDGRPGDPSMAEAVMMELGELHPAGKLLVERVGWNKFDTSFFKPYSEQIDADSRIHSTFKPWGTVTGRLSSGGEDMEKITGARKVRGVNLQQVPRNSLVRGIFGAAPGHWFIEADYSQIELRIAAFMARETTMLHLYATGQDIHMAMAMRMTGKPASAVTKEERKRAKAVNFGFLYGMGWRKFIETAWSNYGLRVSEEESKAFRKSFFDQFPGLTPWHAKQRRLATKYGRVETPMGRVRHLPDIFSPDDGVRSEAERQAINSPVQGFASDMALLSLVHTARKFRKLGIRAWPIGAVHDAVNFEVHQDDAEKALPIIKHTMENLPLDRLFGIVLDVPIVADLKVGKHWGGATEIPEDILGMDAFSNVRLAEWLRDKREEIAA